MARRPTLNVRIALVGTFALLVAGLILPNVSAQFPRQPFPGGGPGMQPRVPEPPRMPEIPRPNFPQPQMPEGPRFGGIERVWTCGKCGKEIGRGAFPPGTCPHCGVRIVNGMGGGDQPAQPNNNGEFNTPDNRTRRGMQPRPQPGIQPPQGGDFNAGNFDPPPMNPQPAFGGQPDLNENWLPPANEFPQAKPEASSSSGLFWTVFGIVFGLIILLVIGLVLFAVLSQSGKKKARRKPTRASTRKRRDDDDDDDDDYIPRSKRRRYDD